MTVAHHIEKMLLFRPARKLKWHPSEAGIAIEEVRLRADDGVSLGAWFLPGRADLPTVLFCQGNKGNRSWRSDTLRFLHSVGVPALIFDYRGYGDSEGRPGEQGLYADVRAAFRELTHRRGIDPARVTLYGRSLGGAVAIDLAADLEDRFRSLLVEASFSSLRDAASFQPYAPVLTRLVRSRFESIAKIGRVRRPVLITHGDQDRRIPIQQGRLLFARANPPKSFFEIDGAGHGDLVRLGGDAYRNRIREFLTSEPDGTKITR